MSKLFLNAGALLLALTILGGYSKDFYVAPKGDGGATGTIGDPFKTVKASVGHAHTGISIDRKSRPYTHDQPGECWKGILFVIFCTSSVEHRQPQIMYHVVVCDLTYV